MFGYVITCVVVISAITAIIIAVRRRRSPSQVVDPAIATTNPSLQTVLLPSQVGAARDSQVLPFDKLTSPKINRELALLIQDAECQVAQPSSTHGGALLVLASSGQGSAPDEARPQDSVAKTDIHIAPVREEQKDFDEIVSGPELNTAPRQNWEPGVSTVPNTTTKISPSVSDVHADAAPELGPRLIRPDTGPEQSEAIDGHEAGVACEGTSPTAEAGTLITPEEVATNVEPLGVAPEELATATTADEITDANDVDQSSVSPTSVDELARKRQKTAEERRPRKYEGLSRSTPQPEDTKGQKQRAPSAETSTPDHSLPLAVRFRFDRDGFCSISLIAKRSEGLPEEIVVATRSGPVELGAMQDEWYQDIVPHNISHVLLEGAVWTLEALKGQFIWSLSGRELFVLSARQDISGYVSQSCLDLGRNHVVLCTEKIKSQVEEAIRATGARPTAELHESMGAPPGWVAFRDVIPTRPVPPVGEVDVFNALRPIPQIEISLEEGVRLDYANWIEGHPPLIRVYGDPQHTADVRIDGHSACLGDDDYYRAPGWDLVGPHSVWCAGTNRSYTIIPFAASWEWWDAYTFPVFYGFPKSISVCGPLVQSSIADGRRREPSIVVPQTNPVLLGSAPGEYAIAERVSDIRWTPLIASPPFRPVWALPHDPLHCDKTEVRILLIHDEEPQQKTIRSAQSPKRQSKHLDAWSALILDASRKGLRTDPDTDAGRALWLLYKRLARQIRRGRG